jgi:hypothetical protein
MSTAMKMDGKSAAIQLGKALNDPKIGLTMLGRSGVTFSESQKKLINSLVDTNQLAKAQAIILREINSEFGGSAEAARKAGLGPWQAFMNAMYDHMEHLGPMLNKGLVKIMELTGWIERNAQMIKLWGTVVATFVAGYYSWIALTKAWSIAMAIYKSVVFINIGLTRGWAVAQRALNITMAANPIGMLIAGVAALGTAIYLLINKLNKANSVYDSIMRNAEENTIRERMELDLLFDALKKTNPESEERKKLLEQIDDKYPGLLKNMKLEKAGLDEISTAYQAIAESIEQKAKMAAAQDMLEQVYKERFKLQNEGPSTWDFALSALSSNPGNAMAGRLSNKFSVLAKKEAELKKLLMGDNSYFTPNSIIDPDPDPDPDPLGGDGIAENITSGGSRPTNITINLGKFQDQIVIHAANVKEGASEMRNIIMEELTRVINSANYSVSQ